MIGISASNVRVGGFRGGAFSPGQLENLFYWFSMNQSAVTVDGSNNVLTIPQVAGSSGYTLTPFDNPSTLATRDTVNGKYWLNPNAVLGMDYRHTMAAFSTYTHTIVFKKGTPNDMIMSSCIPNSNGKSYLYLSNGTTAPYFTNRAEGLIMTSSQTIANNTYHVITIIYKKSGGTCKMYMDGVLVASAANANTSDANINTPWNGYSSVYNGMRSALFAESVLVNGESSEADILALHSYFRTYYGI